jgi:putative DNA primase/helicase
VDRFRAGSLDNFDGFRSRAARWAQDYSNDLKVAEPHVPDVLNDRAQDNSRALCAIADNAGGKWAQDIRKAIVDLASQQDDDPMSSGVRLLKDIAGIIASANDKQIPSAKLCNCLRIIEEAPWGEWRAGQPITTRGVAKLLKPFGVKPRRNNAGSYYLFDDFSDPIMRYVDIAATETATSATTELSATEKTNEINEPLQNGSSGTCGGVAENNIYGQPHGEMKDFDL